MCTTGVLRSSHDEYLLFKNKDFGREHFDDRISLDRHTFGVEGITTWAGTDPARDEFSGFSIGANEYGLLCCDSNVQTVPGHANYDDLVEIALREGEDVDSAVEAVEAAVAARPYLWGNLVVIDGAATAAVEIRGDESLIVRGGDRLARSNHHVELGVHPGDDDTITSEKRLRSAREHLASAHSIEDIVALQRSHDDGETGICNHALHQTVYSYILSHRRGVTTLHVAQGRPCAAQERVRLTVPLGELWSVEAADAFLAHYPSARTAAVA